MNSPESLSWRVMVVIGLVLVTAPGILERLDAPVLVALLALAFAAVFAFYRYRRGWSLSDGFLAMLAFAYAWGVLVSVDRELSLGAVAVLGALLVTYLVGRFSNDTQFLVLSIGFASLVLSVSVLIEFVGEILLRERLFVGVVGQPVLDWALVPRAAGLAGHPNIAAMTLIGVLPMAAIAGLTARGWRRRFFGLVVLLSLLAAFATGSRGGVLGMVTGIGSLALLAGGGPVLRKIGWRRAAGVGALLMAAFALAGPNFIARGFGRAEIWKATWDVVKQRPLGSGPGTLAVLLPGAYRGPADFTMHVVHAHNSYLQAAAELGLPGVLILTVGMLLLIVHVVHDARSDGGLSSLQLGSLAGLAGIAVHGVFDSAQVWPATLAIVGLLMGFLGRDTNKGGEENRSALVAFRTVLLVFLAIPVIASVAVAGRNTAVDEASELGDRGQWEESVRALEDQAGPTAKQLEAVAYARAGDLSAGSEAAEDALLQRPHEWSLWMLKAQLAALHGDVQDAAKLAEVAVAAGAATDPVGNLLAAELMPDRREFFTSTALAQYPPLLASDVWSAFGLSSNQFDSAVRYAATNSNACRLAAAWPEGGIELAGEELVADIGRICENQVAAGVATPEEGYVAAYNLAWAAGRPLASQHRADPVRFLRTGAVGRRAQALVALSEGDQFAYRVQLVGAAIAGDLYSVNKLLEMPGIDEATSRVAEGFGWRALRAPVVGTGDSTIPVRLIYRYAAAFGVSGYSEGPILPGLWESAVTWPNETFLHLVGRQAPNSE